MTLFRYLVLCCLVASAYDVSARAARDSASRVARDAARGAEHAAGVLPRRTVPLPEAQACRSCSSRPSRAACGSPFPARRARRAARPVPERRRLARHDALHPRAAHRQRRRLARAHRRFPARRRARRHGAGSSGSSASARCIRAWSASATTSAPRATALLGLLRGAAPPAQAAAMEAGAAAAPGAAAARRGDARRGADRPGNPRRLARRAAAADRPAAPAAPLTEAEIEALEKALEPWDAFLVYVIRQIALDSESSALRTAPVHPAARQPLPS